jgi:hypothetical protein
MEDKRVIKEIGSLINENMERERVIKRQQEKIDDNRKRLKVLQHFLKTGEVIG